MCRGGNSNYSDCFLVIARCFFYVEMGPWGSGGPLAACHGESGSGFPLSGGALGPQAQDFMLSFHEP